MLADVNPETRNLLTNFGEKIGIAFQLADDVIDIASESTQSGKTPGTDLREGVPTLVTLQILTSTNVEDSQLRSQLAGPLSESEAQKVLEQLRIHSALKAAREYLHKLANEARAMLGPLPSGPAKSALENLCSAIVERTS